MESSNLASKALVYVSAPPDNGTILRQYHMDLTLEGDSFHCMLSTSARSVNPDKKIFVYLVLDASHVESLETRNDETIPTEVTNTFVKQSRCVASTEILSMRFTLKHQAPVVSPHSVLQKRPSTCDAVEALLRIGQCEAIQIYVPCHSVKQQQLLGLSNSLAQGTLKPALEDVMKTLYAGTGSKIFTDIDELWTLGPAECPPAYDEATAAGASTRESSVLADNGPPRGRRARGKRQISPEPRQTATKRHAMAEKARQEPWEVAIAAQSMQLAALNAQLVALREEMQQFRRPPMTDAGSQTEPAPSVSEGQASPATPVSQGGSWPALCVASGSQASTVENSVEERLMMVEDSLVDEQRVRRRLEEQIKNNDERIRQTLDVECSGLEDAVTEVECRVEDIEKDFRDDLRQELSIELRTKLEEFIEFRLEDVEEVVKHDVRMAMENGSYKLKMELNWLE